MKRTGLSLRFRGALLLAALAALLPDGCAQAGDWRCYECLLRRVLPSGGDVVLVLGLQDGQVRRCAVKIASEPYTTCRVKEHALKLDGGRLRGPMRLQVGPGAESIDLDVALDKGGTYAVAYGCPDPPRKVAGGVTIEHPSWLGASGRVVCLQEALGPGRHLWLMFDVDRKARTFKALPAVAPGYNRGRHPVDTSALAFDGTNLRGEVGITIVPAPAAKWLSAWVPAHRHSADGRIKLDASLDGGEAAGRYSAVFGIEKHRRGEVAVRATTEARLRAMIEPVISPRTPWRIWLATAPRIARGPEGRMAFARGREEYDAATAHLAPLPPAGWAGRDFDDSLWGRYQDDLFELMGAYGVPAESHDAAMLCLRTRFGASDLARAADVTVTVEYIGGAAVHVNGVEVARGHLPPGTLQPHTLADDYPPEAYTADDGQPLPPLGRGVQPEERYFARYQARVRTLTAAVPRGLLVKGGNVLAVEVHRAPVNASRRQGGNWSHMGIRAVSVTSPTGAALIGFARALAGTRVWNAQATEQVADDPQPPSRIPGGWSNESRDVYGIRGSSVTGIGMGNPFDPVVPVRILVPRNGVGHGQAVLSDPNGLHQLAAAVADFRGPGAAALPVAAVRIRFAAQGSDFHWCDDLLDAPPDGAETIPVWLEVRARADQRPGWYTSTLSLKADGKTFQVPVQVFVTAFAVPDAKDFRALVGVMHSPEALAEAYQVRPWSDEHFKLMARSLELAGKLGNDVMYVPVIVGTHMGYKAGLIRWVETAKGLRPDFRLFEKYLDLYARCCAAPKAISLYVWSPDVANEVADVYEGRQIPSRTWTARKPLLVTCWDPNTGRTRDVRAPMFGQDGAEAFWKPMLDGVRGIVTRRGWSERTIMLGCGSDMRPSRKTGELFRRWAPYARWDIYSHFSGDPGVGGAPSGSFYRGPPLRGSGPGKMIAVGDLEVGLKEYPWGDDGAWQRKLDFLDMPLQRAWFYDQSPPMSFRTLPLLSGRLARVGLDFWPEHVRYAPLIWGLYPIHLAGRGPDGPLPTVRLALMREAMQDFEPRLAILKAMANLPPDRQQPFRRLLEELRYRVGVGNGFLSQMELGLDWQAYAARTYRAAEELAGVRAEASWDRPPR